MGATRGIGRSKYRLSVVTSLRIEKRRNDRRGDKELNPFDLLLSIGQLCQLTDLGSSLSPDDKS